MSDAKLIRYLKRPLRSGTVQGQLVILTESKAKKRGKYLQNVQHTLPNFNIRFKGILLDGSFVVHTDNNPLSYTQTAKLGATEMRWVAQLAQFNF